MQKFLTISLIIFLASVTGCSSSHFPFLYRPDVQQGNVFTPAMVARLKPGMSTDEVRYIMGAPLLVNSFSNNRWEYVYTFRHGNNPRKQQQLIIYFANGRLTQFTQAGG